jgi:hypothetical protein
VSPLFPILPTLETSAYHQDVGSDQRKLVAALL